MTTSMNQHDHPPATASTRTDAAAAAAAAPTTRAGRRRRPLIATISRIESFSAAHRLHSPFLSVEENRQIFGKCNHVNFHGHNYTLQVFVSGPIDERTGMVVNIADLKVGIQRAVLDHVDHRNLDLDVPFFVQGVPSTTENLAVFIFRQLRKHLPQYLGPMGDGIVAPRLVKVTIWETSKNVVEYTGEGDEEEGDVEVDAAGPSEAVKPSLSLA
ncbi:6-pyruvoyl tetrahydropterin synthase/QueD family protein [Allomyces macrogynus ATCC 38327]|uniref:6-pyruvoyltetrahydropterin synthase n=1 Tax=Allomyces macrogynus (strain ATCC 38327) TaxID=578462 RepID=A0A0L0S9G2_ALLM3|nr:6-pyruvoyl tetrahydropterin synthase/QueD family protein [Allomyces macrogynus ATCC 38327]|eukprot:KNE59030.1 6-pyruvoyl tetrahydropterin synthase/QueD family protein [Allomyces macrogynus ATCC 38327]